MILVVSGSKEREFSPGTYTLLVLAVEKRHMVRTGRKASVFAHTFRFMERFLSIIVILFVSEE